MFSHLFPLISILVLFSTLSYGQGWSGILAPSRAIDWSVAGLPATIPSAGGNETTPNPWTPPTRMQCGSTIAAGASAATINAAIATCAPNHYVLLGPGTFPLGGSIKMTTNNVTLRGSGAASTKLTGGGINLGGGGWWAGATLLTANPAKGATSVTVQSPPSAGRLVSLEQCDDGWSAASADYTHYGSGTKCSIGAYRDPLGPWVCGLTTTCDRNGGDMGGGNPHFQEHVLWIPSGGVSGNTVTFSSRLESANWSTARTAAITWLSNPSVAGAGVEDLSIENNSIGFNGTYACWVKGVRIVSTASNPVLLSFHFDAHSLVANSYIANTQGGSGAEIIQWGMDSGEQAQSDHLFINNIIEGGYAYGLGDQINQVYAYNYYPTANNSGWVENGNAQHHAGTSFILNEGNQMGSSMDDDTWGTHNFNTWFRNYVSCLDPTFPSTGGPALQIGGWARFDNAVGNALGGGTCSNSYAGLWDLNGPGGFNTDGSGLTKASFLRWGNYVQCSGDAHCNTSSFDSLEVPSNLSSFGANSTPYQNSVPANHNLPASFFMSVNSAPSWWVVCKTWNTFPTSCAATQTQPYPAIGPDVTGGSHLSGHAYDIPAAVAWASLPDDASYPTSWGHLRQFDASVYGNSSGGNTSPSAPTGLTAAVQ
jgi:hypothetical protein